MAEVRESYFKRFLLNGSLIFETSAHFSRLFEMSPSPNANKLKQTVQNILMATVEFSLANTE